MRVAITHRTHLQYDAEVLEGVMDTRLGPRSDGDQQWERFELLTEPVAAVRSYSDGFANAAHLITLAKQHDFLEVVSRSVVRTLLDDPFRQPRQPPRPLQARERADYLSPSRLVPTSPEVADLARPYRPIGPEDVLASLQQLMAFVYTSFRYRQDVTTVATTVPEVLKGQEGVCQDFAHVMIALSRAIDVPARYVSGYIVPNGSASTTAGQAPSRGAGASHAWVEAYVPGYGWRGFDATNNLVASTSHVKMAIGRDYADVPPTRGTFRGHAAEHLRVDVAVHPLD